jgi:hypothetical protein
MLHSLLRRSLLVLALGLSLGSSSAFAAPVSWGGFLAEQGRSASRVLEAVLTKLPGFAKAGCSISPDGQPQCAPIPTPKHGCSINPDGHTVCTP